MEATISYALLWPNISKALLEGRLYLDDHLFHVLRSGDRDHYMTGAEDCRVTLMKIQTCTDWISIYTYDINIYQILSIEVLVKVLLNKTHLE